MRALLLFFLFVFFVGCAQKNVTNEDSGSLNESVEKILNARMTNQWDVVYDMSDASYKKAVAKDVFLKMKRGMTFQKYEILEIQEKDNSATVIVRWDVLFGGYVFSGQQERQNWVRENNSWFFVMPHDDKFGFDSKKK